MFIPKNQRSKNREDKWIAILSSQDECYTSDIQLMEFRKHVTVKPRVFAKTIAALYGDFCDPAARNIMLPIKYNIKSIMEMFRNIGLYPDEAKIQTVLAILKPICPPDLFVSE